MQDGSHFTWNHHQWSKSFIKSSWLEKKSFYGNISTMEIFFNDIIKKILSIHFMIFDKERNNNKN